MMRETKLLSLVGRVRRSSVDAADAMLENLGAPIIKTVIATASLPLSYFGLLESCGSMIDAANVW